MTQAIAESNASNNEFLGEYDEDSAAEEMLKRFLPPEDAKKPSEDEEEKKTKKSADPKEDKADEEGSDKDTQDDAEKPEGDKDEETDEGDEDEGETEKKFAEGDDVYVKVQVGDEVHEYPIKELKRLAGQEAALTKKSMAVAERNKQLDDTFTKQAAATTALLERAKAEWEPYSKLDFHLLAAKLPVEEYQAVRQSAQKAFENVEFLEKHLDGFMGQIKERQKAALAERVKEAIAVLSDPEKGIAGWGDKLYNEIREYAISQGAPAAVINDIVDPWAIKMMHAAMLYARGKDKANVVVVKKKKQPTKIIKSRESASPEADREDKKSAKTKSVSKAETKLKQTGDVDDAAELMMARWAKPSDD